MSVDSLQPHRLNGRPGKEQGRASIINEALKRRAREKEGERESGAVLKHY